MFVAVFFFSWSNQSMKMQCTKRCIQKTRTVFLFRLLWCFFFLLCWFFFAGWFWVLEPDYTCTNLMNQKKIALYMFYSLNRFSFSESFLLMPYFVTFGIMLMCIRIGNRFDGEKWNQPLYCRLYEWIHSLSRIYQRHENNQQIFAQIRNLVLFFSLHICIVSPKYGILIGLAIVVGVVFFSLFLIRRNVLCIVCFVQGNHVLNVRHLS